MHTNSTNQSDHELRTFRIDVPQEQLDDLQKRLEQTRWPDDLKFDGEKRNYGIRLQEVKELAEYWRTSYNWREHEARLNELPQYKTTIDGANVHFIHVRSPEPGALPLILTHGWPGSIIEFLDMIGPLTNPEAYGGNRVDAFHVIIPSIPGFGFSGPTKEGGWNFHRVAKAWAELMKRLGYEHYGAQGGDWGSAISRELGVVAPNNVVGIHINFLPFGDIGNPNQEGNMVPKWRKERTDDLFGYIKIQSTRPQTLAYGLTDSPVGQLAWIAEKFLEWQDPASPIDKERLLTNVMFYWLTGTANSSARFYHEAATYRKNAKEVPLHVPLGMAVFPHELSIPKRHIVEQKFKTVHWSELERGGHFAALEVPELLTEDIRTFFRTLR